MAYANGLAFVNKCLCVLRSVGLTRMSAVGGEERCAQK